MLVKSAVLACALLSATAVNAQTCQPLSPPMGQPTLAGVAPVYSGTVPVAELHASGNPGFAISSFAPAPITPGSPTWLVFFFNPDGLVKAPAVFPYCFGERPLIPPYAHGNKIVPILAGPAGPTPGAPVSFPLPPLPPGITVIATTIGFDAWACVFVTEGITISS